MRRERPLRIFVVENHADTAKWLRIYLEECGHTVLSAATLTEALRLFPSSESDVLLADIGLPDGVGWDILESLDRSDSVFAIAMSGFGLNADIGRSARSGFQAHLIKPFRVADLDRLLELAASELNASPPMQSPPVS